MLTPEWNPSEVLHQGHRYINIPSRNEKMWMLANSLILELSRGGLLKALATKQKIMYFIENVSVYNFMLNAA